MTKRQADALLRKDLRKFCAMFRQFGKDSLLLATLANLSLIHICSRTMQELGDMFDREVAETDSGRDFDLANPRGMEENVKSAPKTIQSLSLIHI